MNKLSQEPPFGNIIGRLFSGCFLPRTGYWPQVYIKNPETAKCVLLPRLSCFQSTCQNKVYCLFPRLNCFISGCEYTCPEPIPAEENKILIRVHVLTDQPEDKFTYELMSGTPTEVGVYKFYLKRPDLPGSGTFEKVDVITLQKIENDTYYGGKFIKKINETLCVGFPPVNFIDGKACVEIDTNENETNVTVHYWETKIGLEMND